MFRRLDKKLKKALEKTELPFCGFNAADEKILKQFALNEKNLSLTYELDMPIEAIKTSLQQIIEQALLSVDRSLNITIHFNSKIRCHQTQLKNSYIKNISNVIAVASGKGGVGKSTTAVNLAIAMAKAGARVGLLDADIYGPSAAKMLGTEGSELSGDDKKFNPIEKHGIYSTSIAYMMDSTKALVWRGPMVSNALKQLLNHTLWPKLDYLFIDMPPGTGDIHLTMSQHIPVNGAVIVTTPQDIAMIDARKAISLFNKVAIPVLGVVENMSVHVCSQCGHQEHLFGSGAAEKLAKETGVNVLAQLPLDIAIRQHADNGSSIASDTKAQNIADTYTDISMTLAGLLAKQAINYATKLPQVKVESS